MSRAQQTRVLPPPPVDDDQALIRLEHLGKWLAWTEKTLQLIASGDSPEEVRALAAKGGHRRFIYDWVPPIGDDEAVGLA